QQRPYRRFRRWSRQGRMDRRQFIDRCLLCAGLQSGPSPDIARLYPGRKSTSPADRLDARQRRRGNSVVASRQQRQPAGRDAVAELHGTAQPERTVRQDFLEPQSGQCHQHGAPDRVSTAVHRHLHAPMRQWLFLALALASANTSAAWTSDQWDVMGTRATLEFWCEPQANAQIQCDAVTHHVRREFERLNALLSPWQPDSELAQVNAHASDHPVAISDEFMQLLQRSAHYFAVTDGAFDITFASAGALYDYRNGKAPDDKQLSAARQLIGFHHLIITNDTVAFARDGVRIDL